MFNKLTVLYVSSKRAKERTALNAHQQIRTVEFHTRDHQGFTSHLDSLKNFGRQLRSENVDIVLFETVGLRTFFYWLITKFMRKVCVVRIKGEAWEQFSLQHIATISPSTSIYRLLTAIVASLSYSFADELMPISKHIANTTRQRMPKKLVHEVGIPYDEALYQYIVESEQPRGNREHVVITVTNFNFWEKVEPLVTNIHTLAQEIESRNLQWLIVGGGTYLEHAKKASGIHKDKYIGQVDAVQVRNLYANAKLSLYVSGSDGLPNVVIESALFKLPLILNRSSPAAEFVQHRQNGYLFDLSQQAELGTLLDEVLSDDHTVTKVIENNFRHAQECYSPVAIGAALYQGFCRIEQIQRKHANGSQAINY